MKITIFGASGRTGKYLLRQALEAGHEVSVLVRSPEKLAAGGPGLSVLQGDVRDLEPVSRAIAGAGAVISVLGPVRGGPPGVMALAAENIVAAMKAHGVRRIVFTGGAGVPSPEDRPNFTSRLMGFLVRTLAREVYKDSLRATEIIMQSGLDWTIARGPMLRDASYDGKYQAGFVGNGMNRVLSRGNFADFVLNQLDDRTYLHRLPAVSDVLGR